MGAFFAKPASEHIVEEDDPLVGLPPDKALSVIPIYRTSLRKSYVLNKVTMLKLRKTSLVSVESDILDSRGFYVFRKSGSLVTCALEFRDDAGNILASVEKNSRCSKTTAWIKQGDSSELVVATLVYVYRGAKSKASIYTYQTPIQISDVNNHRRKPTIEVERNPEPTMFTLEIGPNTDIAFITICTAIVDLLHLKSRLSPLGWSTCCADGDSDSEGDEHDHHDDHNNHKQTSQLIQHNSDNDQQKLTILNDDHYDS